jgi:hypothetical protein
MEQLLNVHLVAKRTTMLMAINLLSPPIGSDLTEIALAATR